MMYSVSSELYLEVAARLAEAIGGGSYFSGSLTFPFGDMECRLTASVIVYRRVERLPEGDHESRAIVAQMKDDEAQHARAAEEAGVAHRVTFLGAVADDQLPELYRNALAVVYVPFDEDYGLVTLEGFLAAKPVVTATDSGGTLEFVADGVTGRVTAPDPRAVGEAIAELHGARHLAAAFGAAGRERAAAITWDQVIDRLVSHG